MEIVIQPFCRICTIIVLDKVKHIAPMIADTHKIALIGLILKLSFTALLLHIGSK